MQTAGRVLVVEDHEPERRAVSQILKSEGFTVFGSESADKAMGTSTRTSTSSSPT